MPRQDRIASFLNKEAHMLTHLLQDVEGFLGLLMSRQQDLKISSLACKNIFKVSSSFKKEISAQIQYTTLPFPAECFDVIIAYHIFDHSEPLANILLEIKRVLRHDGTLLISGCKGMRYSAHPIQKYFSKKNRIDDLLSIQAQLHQSAFHFETHAFDFCRASALEKTLAHVLPFLGRGFWIKARKETIPLTLLPDLDWDLKPVIAPISKPEYFRPKRTSMTPPSCKE